MLWEESLKTAQVGLQNTGINSITSYCFPLAKPSSRLGISLQTFLSFVREAGFVNLMPTINLRVFLLCVINSIFVLDFEFYITHLPRVGEHYIQFY